MSYIEDTCACGAKFMVATACDASRRQHDYWLTAHAVCRSNRTDILESENRRLTERIEALERMHEPIDDVDKWIADDLRGMLDKDKDL